MRFILANLVSRLALFFLHPKLNGVADKFKDFCRHPRIQTDTCKSHELSEDFGFGHAFGFICKAILLCFHVDEYLCFKFKVIHVFK